MSTWSVMYLTLDGWVPGDVKTAPLGAVKACRQRTMLAGAFQGFPPLLGKEEILDPEGAAVLEERFGRRPVGW